MGEKGNLDPATVTGAAERGPSVASQAVGAAAGTGSKFADAATAAAGGAAVTAATARLGKEEEEDEEGSPARGDGETDS